MPHERVGTLLVDGCEVIGSQHHQPSSDSSWVCVVVGSTQLTSSTWWRFQYLQNTSKMLCVSLEGEPGPCPRLHYCLLTVSSLSLQSLVVFELLNHV